MGADGAEEPACTRGTCRFRAPAAPAWRLHSSLLAALSPGGAIAAVLIVTRSRLPMQVSRNTVVQPHTHISRAFDPRSADLVGRFPCEGKRPFFVLPSLCGNR
ncbi:hypothetical protein XFF6166_550024 [Xanthomonas citri pv. fuscans]|nr:hypothetical protein XFF6166_550024 [Xanthomonas citri pv. fuscans]SON98949.1 hypothetical protein XFF6960_1060048 [Xanthomonas citri pv. fuscans]SOO06172.1 hypothetical protein XFF7767_650024 [Xanthomonas citri pv. fuscans]SOO11677.1 hypothetical protein XFF6970_930048 [Xanthomonas citri pv. fuscans]SOO16026.1 hypothetical protein XFF7766_720048 [Xanthomonas citri pv. fuscans]